jgi:hypothetical protein
MGYRLAAPWGDDGPVAPLRAEWLVGAGLTGAFEHTSQPGISARQRLGSATRGPGRRQVAS